MPLSDCEVRDPRVRRTRQLLQGALQNLMQTKSLDEISVQDIAEAATINRATFYDHYTDKFALLEALVAGGFHHLLHEREVKFDGTCPEALGAIVLATCDYLTQTHSSQGCHRQSAFEPLMDAALTTAIRRTLIQGVTSQGSGLPAEVIANAASWAIYGAVKEWVSNPAHTPAEEIVRPIVELMLPMLESVTRFRKPGSLLGVHREPE
jgi:AcrR family transcriptional regulator